MEENKEMLELLQKIEKTNRQNLRTGRLQCLFSLIAALFCGAAFLLVFQFLPQVTQLIGQVTDVATQLQTVLGNLEQVTQELATIDMAGMVADVDALVISGQQGITQAVEKIAALDIDTLNQAIADLAKVIEPLAKLNTLFR